MNPANLIPMTAAGFLSGGGQIVYAAHEAGRPPRTWLQDVSGGTPRPITEEGTVGWLVSPDDKWLLTGLRTSYTRLRNPVLVPVAGGSPQKAVGLQPDESVLGWTSDNQLYVEPNADEKGMTFHISKVNPLTGVRTAWRDLPKPAVGGIFPDPPLISPDGASYLYDYSLRLQDIYIVSGVR